MAYDEGANDCMQSLAPSNPHWARVDGYGPFSLCVIHKEGLCPRSEDSNRLMMMTLLSNHNGVGVDLIIIMSFFMVFLKFG
jgi:hypothetical protein